MNGGRHGILLLGPGRVGLSLATLFERAGLEVLGIWGRRESSLAAVRGAVRAPLSHGEIPVVLERAGVVLLTVADGAIAGLAGRLAGSERLVAGTVICHCAGALDAGALEPVRAAGAVTGTMHPLQSVPSVEAGVGSLPGSCFSLEGAAEAIVEARRLVEAIGGRPMVLGPGERMLYHAAAALAGNYLVTLLRSAAAMLEEAGMPAGEGAAALDPMVRRVAERCGGGEAGTALTGPVARGDAATLAAHLDAVARARSADLDLFVALTLRTIDHVAAAGTLDGVTIERMRAVVREHGRPRRGGPSARQGGPERTA